MKIKEGLEEEFNKVVEINSHDAYSNGTMSYAIRWAELMELLIDAGETINDMAKETSDKADTEGITGFMYGYAVRILSKFWVYGEDLRKWHNQEYSYEGDGVVNPAIIGI